VQAVLLPWLLERRGVPGDYVHLEGKTLRGRANALKLLSQQYLKQVVRIKSAGEALAGQALSAGLLP
jgi:hypothetical protein